MEFSKTSGLLYLVSDSGAAGGISIFDPTAGKRLQRIKVAYDPTFFGETKEELEGITIWDLDRGQVHLIMIDNVGRGVFLIGHSSGNFRLTVHEMKSISDFSPQL